MLCKQCRDKADREEKKHQSREKSLLAKLRHPDAAKCNCHKKVKPKEKAHAALNDAWGHKENCPIASVPGYRQWDGKNMGVTLDDIRFLHTRGKGW